MPSQEFYDMLDSLVAIDSQVASPSAVGTARSTAELKDFLNQTEMFENLEMHWQASMPSVDSRTETSPSTESLGGDK